MSSLSIIAVASSSSSPSSSSPQHYHHQQDSLLQMNIRSREEMESGQYPVRESEPDCKYYIRTGLCRFGATCRFNHPPNRSQAIDAARIKGEYPERIGQPECQYYLKTGSCKYGTTCKFHHPRDKAGIAGRAALNVMGYPLRPVHTFYFISVILTNFFLQDDPENLINFSHTLIMIIFL